MAAIVNVGKVVERSGERAVTAISRGRKEVNGLGWLCGSMGLLLASLEGIVARGVIVGLWVLGFGVGRRILVA